MFSQVTTFLCGPFFYPVYFASFLHAFDFFVNFAGPQPSPSRPQSAFPHPSASASVNSIAPPIGNHKEKK